jgi:hypothetical protein
MRAYGKDLVAARMAGHSVPELIELVETGGFDFDLSPAKFTQALSRSLPKGLRAAKKLALESGNPPRPPRTKKAAAASGNLAGTDASFANFVKEDLVAALASTTGSMRAAGLTWNQISGKYARAGFAVSVSSLRKSELASRVVETKQGG